MKPEDIKWDDYRPIPRGRMNLLLANAAGPFTFLIWALPYIPKVDLHPIISVVTFGGLLALLADFLFKSAIAAGSFGGDFRKWRRAYLERNDIGWDAIYWLAIDKEGVHVECQIVPSDAPDQWRPLSDRSVAFTLQVPFNPSRQGRIDALAGTRRGQASQWAVTMVVPNRVMLHDSLGDYLELDIENALRAVQNFIMDGDESMVTSLVNHLVVSHTERGNKVGQLSENLSLARTSMHLAIVELLEGSRIPRSKAAKTLRIRLAKELLAIEKKENGHPALIRSLELYAQESPPLVRG